MNPAFDYEPATRFYEALQMYQQISLEVTKGQPFCADDRQARNRVCTALKNRMYDEYQKVCTHKDREGRTMYRAHFGVAGGVTCELCQHTVPNKFNKIKKL